MACRHGGCQEVKPKNFNNPHMVGDFFLQRPEIFFNGGVTAPFNHHTFLTTLISTSGPILKDLAIVFHCRLPATFSPHTSQRLVTQPIFHLTSHPGEQK